MRGLFHCLLVLLVFVLKIDRFRPSFESHYLESGKTDEVGVAHMDIMKRKVYLITVSACVAAMVLGYAISNLFAGSVTGTAGWWLLFCAMVIGAFQFKHREGRKGFSVNALHEALRRK
jgi:hypothetical protein